METSSTAQQTSALDFESLTADILNPQSNKQTLVQNYINSLQSDNPPIQHKGSISMHEYRVRTQQLPYLAHEFNAPKNGFTIPGEFSDSQYRLASGLFSSRYRRSDFRQEMDKEVPAMREMLMLGYEALPRPISYAMHGYKPSDFIAYIYQDTLMADLDMRGANFIENLDVIKEHLRSSVAPRGNNARRHIRRRLSILLDRTSYQISSLLNDREAPGELVMLMQKLLEREDGIGFTQGALRHFRDVRNDFNAIAEFVQHLRYVNNNQMNRLASLKLIICPSRVVDFSKYKLDLPKHRRKTTKK